MWGAADALRSTVRAADVVGRIGGDEFVVIVGDASDEGMRDLIARIRRATGEDRADVDRDTEPIPKLSAGWIARTPAAGETLAGMLDLADTAMYVDKRERRSRSAR